MPNYIPPTDVNLLRRRGDGVMVCPDCYRKLRNTNTGYVCDRCKAVYDLKEKGEGCES